MSYWGDIRLGDTIDIKFTTLSAGLPTTFSGGSLVAYAANDTAEVTAGITLSANFDGRTGLNNVRVVASGANGYLTATDYALVISAGTVGGASVTGYTVASFSIEHRSALMPTTPARTLDVDANGAAEADVRWWVGVAAVSGAIPAVAAGASGGLPLLINSAGVPVVAAIDYGAFQGLAVAGTLSTTQATTDQTGYGNDAFNNGWMIAWSMAGVQQFFGVVTDYDSATGLFTWSPAIGTAVQAGDFFSLYPAATGLAVGNRTGNLSGTTGNTPDILAIKAKTDNLPEGYEQGVGFDLVFFMMDTNRAPVPGLTDGDFTVKDIVQDTAAPTPISGTITAIGGGYYTVALTNAEVNFTQLSFSFLATGTIYTAFTLKASP